LSQPQGIPAAPGKLSPQATNVRHIPRGYA